ncbi:SDR family NAD(P)-dependent oxidoreductase [Geodermatophilus pulveris]|nr:SDR family NAD(P)-dependent oxidoreductase [Geodermatophilus pulveris]
MTVPDITGSIVVTGPTRGLGRALVPELAAAPGAPLVLLGRPGPALEAAAEAGAAADRVVTVPCDLASLAQVRAAASTVRAAVAGGDLPPVAALVSNAGLQTADRRQATVDGFELTFGVNVLAPHTLLESLRPALADGAHVVLLGSGTHHGDRSMGLVDPPRWEDPRDLARPDGPDGDPRAGSRAYATSKLAVLYQAHEWDRRHGAGRPALRVNVHDPGLMPGTGLARGRSAVEQLAWSWLLPALRVLPRVTTPRRSARALADLVLGRTHPRLRAGYVVLGEVTEPSPAAHDPARERELWQVCAELTGVPAPSAAA